VLTRPQSRLADFYRELGDLFGVALTPHNRWAGTKVLRERWLNYADTTLHRPVLLIDEAQEMLSAVLNELRLLASVALDSRLLLTVVLAGDGRLAERLRKDELLPLGSRIRARLDFASTSPDELAESLRHVIDSAGNARLLSEGLITALAEHAAGSHRTLMNLASALFEAAIERNVDQLDEKLFFDVFAPASASDPSAAGRKRSKAS
jgi:type II secretory pathway predicted ATPase ExeA